MIDINDIQTLQQQPEGQQFDRKSFRIDNIRQMHFSRNPKIAEFMQQYKLVKEFGEGVDRMFREMAEAGNPTPEYKQVEFMLKVRLNSALRDEDETGEKSREESTLKSTLETESGQKSGQEAIKRPEKTGEKSREKSREKIVELIKLHTIFNYNRFKTKILSLIDNYVPKNRKDLRQKIKESEELGWSNDVARFMQMSYESDSGMYNLNKTKQFIQDEDVYDVFLLNSINHSDDKCLTKADKECIRKLLNKQLGRKDLEPTTVQNYLRLTMDLEIPLNKSIIKRYICYAACKRTEHSYIGDNGCFLLYACQYIDEKTVNEIAKRVIKKEHGNHAEDCLVLAKYLIDKRENNSYKDILELMQRDDFPYYFQISEHFSKLGKTGYEHLKSIYDNSNVELRLVIIGQLYKDSIYHPWIKQVMERDKELFEKDHKETVLRYGLAFGKDSALSETLEIMKKNNLYFGNFNSAPELGYSDIKYLPQLEQLFKISFMMDEKYTNWSGVIIKAMKNIAIHSEEDMKAVCELLSKYTTTEKWLNRSISNIQSEYYEKHYEKMTIKKAAQMALS